MKFFTKALIILAVILLILALGDSIFNGLFSNDGYRPVTQQMKEIMTGTDRMLIGCSYLAHILYLVS